MDSREGEKMNIKVIGLGGIGSILIEMIARFSNYSMDENGIYITLIDGDSYEHKNRDRQIFGGFGNKSDIKKEEMSLRFTDIEFESIPQFVNGENISEIIKEKDVVFLCVDNHKTRKVVSEFCDSLNEVLLISGGNELLDGNVQIYMKKGGEKLTPSLTDYHPEIQEPEDKSPDEMSCEELAVSTPQLLFTNLGVATLMCFSFYNVLFQDISNISETYFDVSSMECESRSRSPLKQVTAG